MKKLLIKIKGFFYSNRSNAWKAAVNTALWVFIAGFISATTNFISSIQNWITGENLDLYDDVAIYGKAMLSAGLAMFTGLLNYIFRMSQSMGKLPGNGPTYTKKESAPWPPPSTPRER